MRKARHPRRAPRFLPRGRPDTSREGESRPSQTRMYVCVTRETTCCWFIPTPLLSLAAAAAPSCAAERLAFLLHARSQSRLISDVCRRRRLADSEASRRRTVVCPRAKKKYNEMHWTKGFSSAVGDGLSGWLAGGVGRCRRRALRQSRIPAQVIENLESKIGSYSN